MDVYDTLLQAVDTSYDIVKILKKSDRGQVQVIRHRDSGGRYVLRRFEGDGTVYRQLLGLSSPHLPQIIEVGEKDGWVVVLEEYVQGDTLAYVLEGGPLTTAQTRQILRQLCQALWVLHERGIVHRDIKPENVMLRGNEVVLIDLDASRIYKEEQEQDTQILGTTGYAAPEQYGMSQSDERADIYSLGVLLNIMLTGQHPSRKLAPGRMGRMVQRCTMVQPDKRYRSVLHLLEVLS